MYLLEYDLASDWVEKLADPRRQKPKVKKQRTFTHELSFWKDRSLVTNTGCWEFQGARDRDGYGQARRQGVLVAAHRGAWAAANNRPVDRGMVLLHSCDNPPCCNPEHLSPGTQLENMADAKAKGRTASGERNGSSKLSDVERERIRLSDMPARQLAELHHVDIRTIHRVRNMPQ